MLSTLAAVALNTCIVIVSGGTNGDWSEKFWHEIEHCKGQRHAKTEHHTRLKTDHRMYEGPVETMLPNGLLVPFRVQSMADARKACARLGMPGKMACFIMADRLELE